MKLCLSPVCVAELVHGIYRANTPEARRRRGQFISQLLNVVPVRSMTSHTAWLAGQIAGEQASQGNVLPMLDVMIAAAAIEQGFAVLTMNLRHFARVPGLTVIPLL